MLRDARRRHPSSAPSPRHAWRTDAGRTRSCTRSRRGTGSRCGRCVAPPPMPAPSPPTLATAASALGSRAPSRRQDGRAREPSATSAEASACLIAWKLPIGTPNCSRCLTTRRSCRASARSARPAPRRCPARRAARPTARRPGRRQAPAAAHRDDAGHPAGAVDRLDRRESELGSLVEPQLVLAEDEREIAVLAEREQRRLLLQRRLCDRHNASPRSTSPSRGSETNAGAATAIVSTAGSGSPE